MVCDRDPLNMMLELRKILSIIFVFQYGRENIEIARKGRHIIRDNSEDDDEDDAKAQGDKKENVSKNVSSYPANNTNNMLQKPDKKLKNGMLGNSSTSVISREDLILVPDPEQNYTSANSNLNSEGDHMAVAHVSNRLVQKMFISRLLAVAADDAAHSVMLSLAIKILSVGYFFRNTDIDKLFVLVFVHTGEFSVTRT